MRIKQIESNFDKDLPQMNMVNLADKRSGTGIEYDL